MVNFFIESIDLVQPHYDDRNVQNKGKPRKDGATKRQEEEEKL